MSEIKYITTPLTEETVKDLHAGDFVRITGPIYTARDAAHKRMYEALGRGGGSRQRRPDHQWPHGQIHSYHDRAGHERHDRQRLP